MGRHARLALLAAAVAMTGFGFQQPQQQAGILVCRGDFGKFANGFMIARPMELKFVVDWQAPWVQTDGGKPGEIIDLTAMELTFEVQYDGYRVIYHVNRIDGTFSQRPNFGGAFYGNCDLLPYSTKF